jgi:hypothetical protein
MNASFTDIAARRGRLEELHERMHGLLDALDHAELHGPAAYVSMALDTMVRDFPQLSATH